MFFNIFLFWISILFFKMDFLIIFLNFLNIFWIKNSRKLRRRSRKWTARSCSARRSTSPGASSNPTRRSRTDLGDEGILYPQDNNYSNPKHLWVAMLSTSLRIDGVISGHFVFFKLHFIFIWKMYFYLFFKPTYSSMKFRYLLRPI